MSPSPDNPAGLVADASVLIDYAESDRSVLALMSRHLATIHVPSPVFEEVHKLSEKDAARLGIDVVEPTLDQVLEAEAGEGPTSFEDRLCCVVGRDAGWSVMTNDAALRRVCDSIGIGCVWGLEAMTLLVERQHLSTERAVAIAEKIASVNIYITPKVLARFRKGIGL